MKLAPFNLSSLPKWAQRRLENREMRIQELEEQVKSQANPGPTAVVVNEGFPGAQTDYWAPDRSRVRFYLPDVEPTLQRPDPTKRSRWIEFALRDGRVHAYASESLAVRPHSGNVVTLDTEAF